MAEHGHPHLVLRNFALTIWYVLPGSSDLPRTGRRTRGRQAADFFAVMWPYYAAGKSAADIKDIVSDDRNVVVIGSFSHVIEQNGKSFTTPIALHLKMDDGKISHLRLYEDALLISQAFGAAGGAPAVGPDDPPGSLGGGAAIRQ